MKAFIAVDLPDQWIDALTRLQSLLPVGRKVAPEALHLTLAFLDDQPDHVLDELHQELEAQTTTPLSLTVQGVGRFGAEKPRLVFANAIKSKALEELRHGVHSAARRSGITLRHEKFHPHITLARISGRPPLPDLAQLERFLSDHAGFSLPNTRCLSFSLIHSELSSKGAR